MLCRMVLRGTFLSVIEQVLVLHQAIPMISLGNGLLRKLYTPHFRRMVGSCEIENYTRPDKMEKVL